MFDVSAAAIIVKRYFQTPLIHFCILLSWQGETRDCVYPHWQQLAKPSFDHLSSLSNGDTRVDIVVGRQKAVNRRCL